MSMLVIHINNHTSISLYPYHYIYYSYEYTSPHTILTGTGSRLCSSLIVRSRIPELIAFFFPSAPPDSKRFCINAAMLLRTSGEEQADWARLVSLGGRRRGGEEGRRGGGEEGRRNVKLESTQI